MVKSRMPMAPTCGGEEGPLGAKHPEKVFDHAIVALRKRLFEHRN